MNQSHDSCSNLYDCSCEELDNLTQICRNAGAYGSRLTGAGWGGCAVSLIPNNILDSFLSKIKTDYYSKSARLEEQFSNAAFATKPSNGIQLIKLI
jgi:galactokinase